MTWRYWWQHTDPRGLSSAMDAGMARAIAQDWSGAGAVADLRAFLLANALVMNWTSGYLSFDGAVSDADPVPIDIASSLDDLGGGSEYEPARVTAGGALWRCTSLLAGANSDADLARLDQDLSSVGPYFGTSGGDPAQVLVRDVVDPHVEAGVWPFVAATAIIIGAAASTVVTFYAVQKAAEIVDRKLARDSEARVLLASQARALTIYEEHSRREMDAGAILPYTQAERDALGTLQSAIGRAEQRMDMQPLPSSLPSGGDLAKAAAFGGGFALPLLIGGVSLAAYFAFKH